MRTGKRRLVTAHANNGHSKCVNYPRALRPSRSVHRRRTACRSYASSPAMMDDGVARTARPEKHSQSGPAASSFVRNSRPFMPPGMTTLRHRQLTDRDEPVQWFVPVRHAVCANHRCGVLGIWIYFRREVLFALYFTRRAPVRFCPAPESMLTFWAPARSLPGTSSATSGLKPDNQGGPCH